ncbi:SDR family NAD(P)-dependent oxidoreductase [Ruegeria sp.]|uniref:SDR family NAD(P)-dependent oxidoreductase n=1 Tax=Ruegeria sp. TaxID=1879320 RepID=UPI003B59C9A7
MKSSENSKAGVGLPVDVSGLSVLVTGASSGLGVHFAKLFAGLGANVTAAARRSEVIEGYSADLSQNSGAIQALKLDVSSTDSVRETLAGRHFDIVINNAGVTVSASALDHDASALDRIIDTNLKGVFAVATTAAETMKEKGTGGSIVNVASILGHRVAGHASAYAASKAGVCQLTKALALEWARYGIRVNSLSPGYVKTELNDAFFSSPQGEALIKRVPMRRLGDPSDLDGAVLLLASDLGRFMTGTDIVVDGGHLVSSL